MTVNLDLPGTIFVAVFALFSHAACWFIGLCQATVTERRDAERHCLECQKSIDADHKRTKAIRVHPIPGRG